MLRPAPSFDPWSAPDDVIERWFKGPQNAPPSPNRERIVSLLAALYPLVSRPTLDERARHASRRLVAAAFFSSDDSIEKAIEIVTETHDPVVAFAALMRQI